MSPRPRLWTVSSMRRVLHTNDQENGSLTSRSPLSHDGLDSHKRVDQLTGNPSTSPFPPSVHTAVEEETVIAASTCARPQPSPVEQRTALTPERDRSPRDRDRSHAARFATTLGAFASQPSLAGRAHASSFGESEPC